MTYIILLMEHPLQQRFVRRKKSDEYRSYKFRSSAGHYFPYTYKGMIVGSQPLNSLAGIKVSRQKLL